MKNLISLADKLIKLLFIIVFVIYLWLPLSEMQFEFTPIGENTEKRELTTFPAFEPKYPYEFMIAFEKYFNDNFGYRKQLIVWNNTLWITVFNYSPVNGVVFGNNGWLYFAQGLTDSYKRPPYTDYQLNIIKDSTKAQQEFFDKNGIHFVTVVAPDKHTVYPEHLPRTLTQNVSNARRAQRLALIKNHTDIIYLDMLKPLLKASEKYQTYYKTDTHWNNYGSFIAYQEIMKELKKEFPNLEPLTLDDFDIVVEGKHEAGDLSTILAMKDKFADEEIKLTLKESAKAKLSEDKKVNKVIIYHDSFFDPHYSWSTIQYLKLHFNTVVDFTNNLAFDNERITVEKPDIVIFEIVERLL